MDRRTLILVVEHTERGETRSFRIDLEKAAYVMAKCPDDLFYTKHYIDEALRMANRGLHREDMIYVPRRSLTNNHIEFKKVEADVSLFFHSVLVIEAVTPVEIDSFGHYHFV